MRSVHVPPECYDSLSTAEIDVIMHELAVKHELPLRFTYAGEGANRWDKAINDLPDEKQKSILPNFAGVHDVLQEHIGSSQVSIIDLGPGNGVQARGLVEYLSKQGQLQQYVAVDISSRMLDIAADNLHRWLHGAVQTIKHVKNFIEEPLDDIFDPKAVDDNPRIVLVLGGTLDNDPSPVPALQKLSQHLRPQDLLLYDILTPTDAPSSSKPFTLSPRHTFLLDLLGIPSDLYEGERIYDARAHTRLDQIILLDDIALIYNGGEGADSVLLKKGEAITIWRYHSQTAEEAKLNLRRSGLRLLAESGRENERQLLLLCDHAGQSLSSLA